MFKGSQAQLRQLRNNFDVVMKRVQHQIMTATPTEKMGVIATDGDVCTKGSFTPNDFTTVTVTLIFLTVTVTGRKGIAHLFCPST